MGDHPILINKIRNTAGKTGTASPIRVTHARFCVAQQRKLKSIALGKGLVRLYGIKTNAQNLDVVPDKRVVVVTEPVPFRRSAPSIRLGIKPEHNFFAPEV